mgnify:CR=1 FL=1
MKIIDTLRKHLVELRDRFDPKKVREIKRIRDFKSKKIRYKIWKIAEKKMTKYKFKDSDYINKKNFQKETLEIRLFKMN